MNSAIHAMMLIITAVSTTSLAAQTVIFDQTYTGADLVLAPGVSFPTRTPVVSGTSLQFGPGSSRREVLMRLPIIPTGTIEEGIAVNVIFDLVLTPLSSDNDLSATLGDGTRLAGGFHADNNGGQGGGIAFLTDPPSPDPNPDEIIVLFSNAGFPPVGSSFDRTTQVCVNDTAIRVAEAFGVGLGETDLVTILDETQSLALVLVAGDAGEQYQVDDLRVRAIENEDCSDVTASRIFVDDFESGDTLRWSITVN